ncbi:MAG: hypothetical protein ABR562_09355 [Thermoplasmatota archaeon]
MAIPDFLLRKMYKRGSLRETGDGRFAFTLLNPLGEATLLAPPHFVINGIAYPPERIQARKLNVATISREAPFVFRKGDKVTLRFPGRLMRGGNRIHISAETREFGEVEIYVEDKEAEFCDMPGSGREEE